MQLVSGRNVPQVDGGIIAITRERLAVRAEGDGMHRLAVYEACLLAGRHIPKPDRLVITPTGERLSVRAECNRGDLTCMSIQATRHSAGRHVPKFYALVQAPGGKGLAVAAEGQS